MAGQYGAPQPGQYGAPPGQYGAPPPGQYGAPPGQYGAPPPGQYGAPPPGQYGAPPPGQYGAPPGQYGAPPPGQYGQYPGQQYQQYGAPQPAPAPGGAKGKGKGAAAAAAPAPPMGAAPMYSAPGMPPQGAGFAPVGMQPQLVPMSSLPQGPFVPGADAEVLWNACKGLGTREADLIRIIGYRPRAQLVQIAAAFQQAHSKSLAKVLHSETSGHFRQLLLKLILPLEELLADLVHEAIAGLGTKDLALIDVITQLTPQEMTMLKEFYPRKYKESLAKAVAGDTSGDYRKLLLALIEGTRQPPGAVGDAVKVEADAERFYRAGAGRLGTDEAAFINLVATNSSEHLQLVSQAYQRVHGKTLEDAIRSETSGHFQDTLIALVNTRAMHFAHRIKYACDRPGTLDTLLVNIFAMNDKLQLKAIGYAYQAMFKASMPNVVSSDTSGDYRKLLLALVD